MIEQRTGDRLLQAVVWLFYAVPFLQAYGHHIVDFMRDWKELVGNAIGAGIGAAAALYIGMRAMKEQARSDREMLEAQLLWQEIQDCWRAAGNLKSHFVSATNHCKALKAAMPKFDIIPFDNTLSMESSVAFRRMLDFIRQPLPSEVRIDLPEHNWLGYTPEMLERLEGPMITRGHLIAMADIQQTHNTEDTREHLQDALRAFYGEMKDVRSMLNEAVIREVDRRTVLSDRLKALRA